MASILIVEDNLPLGQLYMKFFVYMGATVTQVINCKQAMSYLDTEATPDLIILDMSLPDGTGLSIAQYLQSIHKFDQTQVIAVSSDDSFARDVQDMGIKHFFCKPVALPILVARVKQLLAGTIPLQ